MCLSLPDRFTYRLSKIRTGYTTGKYGASRYGVTVSRAAGGKRVKLYAEELGGNDHISFNLYTLSSGVKALKPCEMPEAKVIAFVEGFEAEAPRGGL